MKMNDYAEVEWYTSDIPNLNISSVQWSTHATPYNDFGYGDAVLPGGATLSLSIKQDERQSVAVRTYQCILDGAGREQVELTSGESVFGYNSTTALQYHNNYVNSIADITFLCREG